MTARSTARPILAFVLAPTVLVGACRATGRARGTAAAHVDTAFAAMQSRGARVMGVDQYTSAHVFEDLGMRA